MSREGAYRLRRRRGAGSFNAAWDSIMGAPGTPRPKVTLDPLFQRLAQGRCRPVLRGGRYAGTVRTPDNSALFTALARLDRMIAAARRRRPPGEGHGN